MTRDRRRSYMDEVQETAEQEKRERPKLRLKRDVPEKACPGCGGKMAEDAVVCVHCGWNCQTGKKTRGVETAMRRKRALGTVAKLAVALGIAGAAAAGVRWVMEHRDEAERWIDEGKEKAQALVGGAEERTKAGQTEREAAARERLDRELPMWSAGDEVTLEKKNGAVLEGVLRGAGEGVVTVETPEGIRSVNMGDLSGRSRVRVDGAYREDVVRARLERK